MPKNSSKHPKQPKEAKQPIGGDGPGPNQRCCASCGRANHGRGWWNEAKTWRSPMRSYLSPQLEEVRSNLDKADQGEPNSLDRNRHHWTCPHAHEEHTSWTRELWWRSGTWRHFWALVAAQFWRSAVQRMVNIMEVLILGETDLARRS